jgi:ATP-binding cassette, subfamily G (WHITE), member 2, PDR
VLRKEFSGRRFPCANFVPSGPGYESPSIATSACNFAGSIRSQDFVEGAAHLLSAYGYKTANCWRNFGILIAFMVFFMVLHLIAAQYVASERPKGEVLVFTRSGMAKQGPKPGTDIESGNVGKFQQSSDTEAQNEAVGHMEKHTSVFHWKDVTYDIKINGEPRRILDHVEGWLRPGTLTVLMV